MSQERGRVFELANGKRRQGFEMDGEGRKMGFFFDKQNQDGIEL